LKKDMMQVIWQHGNFRLKLRGRKGIIHHYFTKSIVLRREVRLNKQAVGSINKQLLVRTLLVLAVALGMGTFMFACTRTAEHKIIGVGDRAPEVRLQSVDGKTMSLADYRGKVVLVHFWATWCPPCVEEIPTLERFYQQVVGTDIEVLAVSVDDSADVLKSFLDKNKVHFPVLRDPGGTVAGSYGTLKFPETYIIGRDGMVRYKVIGPMDWSVRTNVETVRSLL
jgi:peroxiredoxin